MLLDRHRVARLIELSALERVAQGAERLRARGGRGLPHPGGLQTTPRRARARTSWRAWASCRRASGRGPRCGRARRAAPSAAPASAASAVGPRPSPAPLLLVLLRGQAESADVDPGNRLPDSRHAGGVAWEPLYRALDAWDTPTIVQWIGPQGWINAATASAGSPARRPGRRPATARICRRRSPRASGRSRGRTRRCSRPGPWSSSPRGRCSIRSRRSAAVVRSRRRSPPRRRHEPRGLGHARHGPRGRGSAARCSTADARARRASPRPHPARSQGRRRSSSSRRCRRPARSRATCCATGARRRPICARCSCDMEEVSRIEGSSRVFAVIATASRGS
jgi:hypothetical protein